MRCLANNSARAAFLLLGLWAATGTAQCQSSGAGVGFRNDLKTPVIVQGVSVVNNMQRRGWSSKLGLGRHRISSTIYFYIENPAGGEAEYSADTDCLDDNWQPRIWEPLFGNQHWVADLPAFLATPPREDVRPLADEMPELAKIH